MIRLVLAATLLLAMVTAHQSGRECQINSGTVLHTFSDSEGRMLFPCKYPAIRKTRCGNWTVTVTPGNALVGPDNDPDYVINTLWVGVSNVVTGQKWTGRTCPTIAQRYLDESRDAPFNKKGGDLETTDVFEFGPVTADHEVALIEKNGAFSVVFSLPSPVDGHSGVSFQCNSSQLFEPQPFPLQLCGNGTTNEIAKFKNNDPNLANFTRRAVIIYSVFTNQLIVQPHGDCQAAAAQMSLACSTQKQYDAARLCSPLLTENRFQRCVIANTQTPISAFNHCVQFVCSDDNSGCVDLSGEINNCQELEVISDMVRDTCATNLNILP